MSDGPRRFSHSLIDCYLRCPRQAEFRYVDNIPSPKTAALMKGSACDEAWNHALVEKMRTGEDIDLESLLEITEESYRDKVHEEGGVSAIDWGDSSARDSLDSALRLTKSWRIGLLPSIEPTAVQVELHRPLPSGRDFIGFLDWRGSFDGAAGVIGDNKTGKRKMAGGDADKGLQPSAYAYHIDEPIDFVFARAIDTGKSQSSEAVFTHRNQGDINWYGELLTDVEHAFDAGVFPTNPTSNLCGMKSCPYFERCQPHRVVTGGLHS